MEDDSEWKNLAVEEKCVHKSWKARVDGYEAAKRLFQSIDDDKSPEWSKYTGLLKKFVVDSNISAQEKALDAVLAYVENYVHAGRTVNEVMSNLVQKCIGSSAKPKTKELSMQISLMYIEIEKQEIVIEELLKGSESKNPKTSCGCLIILTEALKQFGPKVVGVSKIIKKIPGPLSDRDKNVRSEARALVVESYKWIGAPIKQQLSSLKPAQLTELDAEFEKVTGTSPHPTRLLRSQQAKKAVQASGDVADGESEVLEEEECENEIDPTEFLEPVDILSKLPKNFFTQLEEKKWTERRDALDILDKELQSAPRLEPVEYGDLIRALKKIIAKDSNIVVVASALKCLTGLTNGLKKKFTPYINALIPTLFEKFKEKKQNVVVALRECVDAIFLVSHLESISEDVVAALDNKNPCIKNEMSLFLARCFTRCTPTILNKKLLKVLCAGLLKVLNDSDPGARDAAASALGTAMKVVGEKVIVPFLPDIGDQKMTKIKSCCESAQLQKPIRVASTETKGSPAAAAKQPTKTTSRPGTSKAVRPAAKNAPPSKVVKPGGGAGSGDAAKKLGNKIPSDIVGNLNNSDTNKRLQSYEELLSYIQANDIPKDVAQPLLETLSSLDDDNQNIVEAKINCMKAIAEKVDLSGIELKVTIIALLKKYNDTKYNDSVASCLVSFATSIGLDTFAQNVLSQNIVSDKTLWANSLKWLTECILNYNLTFSQELLQRESQKAIKSGNLILRQAGCGLVGVLGLMGSNEPAERQSPPKNQSTVKTDTNKMKKDAKSRDSSPPKSLTDISTIITSQCLAELSDDTWKVKFDALEKIKPLIDNAGPISPNLGEVQPVFEKLLVDKNTKVVQSALNCLVSLIKGLGIHSRKYINYFLPKVLKNVSDPKAWVRNSVLAVLDAYGSAGGYKELFSDDTLAETCSTISLPAAKSEMFVWITRTLNKVESVPRDGLIALCPVLYQCLEDRNVDVRKSSNEAVVTLMMHLGYDVMLNACSNLKGSTASAAKALLDKNRGNFPEPEPTVMRSKSATQLKKLAPGSSATFTKPAKSTSKIGVGRPSMISKKEEEPSSDGPLLECNDTKNLRVQDEQKLRTLKWNFASPRPEFVEQLKEQMSTANVNPQLMLNMFHSDFKFHIKAIDSLAEDLNHNREGIISNLDLVLKWMTLRFFDTNPSVLIKGLEYLINVFNVLIDERYNMLDIEASSFLPYLSNKAGDPKDTVKNHVRNLFKMSALIYPKQKLFNAMMEGLKSKNARLRAEMLELLCFMINSYSLDACTNNVVQTLKEIGKHIADKDTSVRNGALNCMVAAYYLLGEDLYRNLGQLPDGPLTLLEERLKRAAKNRPVASIKPLETPQRPAQQIDNSRIVSPERAQPSVNNLNRTYEVEEPTLNQNYDPCDEPHREIIQQPQEILDNRQPLHPGAIIEATITTGPYRLDPMFYQPLPTFKMPDIVFPDLSWMTPPRIKYAKFDLSKLLPTTQTVKYSDDPNFKEITNPDLEKAITAMAKIETTLYSDRAIMLGPKMDYLVEQLGQQLISLNHSTHPDLVNCYRGNFALINKFTGNNLLCEAITEPTFSCLVKQLLLLLDENKQNLSTQDMFRKAVNESVIKLIENCNKNVVMCSLIKLLQEDVRSPSCAKQYQELLLKCLWKLNKTQPEWDSKLSYPKLLTNINEFFIEFPTSYWRNRDYNIPMKTIKTILHTMVKIRGKKVKEHLDNNVPNVTQDSEISNYVRRVIKHLESSNELPQNVIEEQPSIPVNLNYPSSSENNNLITEGEDFSESEKTLIQLLEPFKNSKSDDALKILYNFLKNDPDLNYDKHLIRLQIPADTIIYIKRGLISLKYQHLRNNN